jgi:predicted 2-oxoglutarate/Fe(II)-dependent dioxygenase YbiX
MRRPGGNRSEIAANLVAGDPVLTGVRERMIEHLRKHHDPALQPEFTLMAEAQVGDHIPVHADNVLCAAGEWKPNHVPYRISTALVYLTEFDGGQIVHTLMGSRFAPPPGGLVSFDCEGHYEHKVEPVTAGRRVSIAMWAALPPHPVEPWA